MQAPTDIKVKSADKLMWLTFAGETHAISFELLRVYSPSAEVKGHGGVGGELPVGKRHVGISKIEPVGNYAIRIFFDDGHNSGLYSWEYLYDLASKQQDYQTEYEAQLAAQGASREPKFINITNL
ncbi:gamma-butyrobetaine hydroxylase-like domain-containing protein [Salinibius halmophilus]|uniref:gamma-butyrobetaine hydroxylase-like domain-containing protein n=1 Tax=Salinibius halmophilus TaxID=1853216 RepID=UPI000E67044D|nr:DUF971 domain-containing protein [Salinibius halmophilus]